MGPLEPACPHIRFAHDIPITYCVWFLVVRGNRELKYRGPRLLYMLCCNHVRLLVKEYDSR